MTKSQHPHAVQSLTNSLVWELCKAIEGAKDLEAIKALLAAAAMLFKLSGDESDSLQQQLSTAAFQPVRGKLNAVWKELQAAANKEDVMKIWRQAVYGQYETYVQVLLTVVAPDWLPCLSSKDRSQLFDYFFFETPAPAALSVLSRHLSQVLPLLKASQQDSSAFVTAIASETASQLVRTRFTLPESTGVRELLLDIAGAAASESEEGGNNPASQLTLNEHTASCWMGMRLTTDQIAGYLVSLPDRLAAAHAVVIPVDFFFNTLQQMFLALADVTLPWGSSLDRHAAVEFVAVLIQRLVTRGHVHDVTQWLVACVTALQASTTNGTSLNGTLPQHTHLPAMPYTQEPNVPADSKMAFDSSAHATSLLNAVAEVLNQAAEAPGAVEKLLERLLVHFAEHDESASRDQSIQMMKMLVKDELFDQPGIRYHLTEKLLIQTTLPMSGLQTLLGFILEMDPLMLEPLALQLARFWGDEHTIQRVMISRQAYATTALVWCLQHIGRTDLEGDPDLVGSITQGISNRLGSPLKAVRRQAMHVGYTFSLILDPSQPLFGDQFPFTLGPEEVWPGAVPSADSRIESKVDSSQETAQEGIRTSSASVASVAAPSEDAAAAARPASPSRIVVGFGVPDEHAPHPRSSARAVDGVAHPDGEVDLWTTHEDAEEEGVKGAWSDPDTESDSDDEFQPYNLDEEDDLDEWEKSDVPPSLRNIAAALRKQEDVEAVLAALRKAEVVIRANPDELSASAGELSRALLHCRVPEWAETEADEQGSERPEVQRVRGLVGLLTQVPEQAGRALIPEVYSPHLDMVQRLTIMDVLCAAAQELALPPSAPRLTFQNKVPKVLDSHRPSASQSVGMRDSTLERDSRPSTPSTILSGAPSTSAATLGTGAAGMPSSQTRVWGHASLRKRGEQPRQTWQNKFVDVVMDWTIALVREVDVKKHGVDMFGRDSLLLGRLLTTLGAFAECCANTPATNPLASVLLELIQAPEVCEHAEPFVRRSALLATSQVMASVSASRLTDDSSLLMLERLRKANAWAAQIANSEADPTSQYLAVSCCHLYRAVVNEALASHQPDNAFILPIGQKSPLTASDIVIPLNRLRL